MTGDYGAEMAGLVNKFRELLVEVANDFEDAGCERCGTISTSTINRVREALGWDLLKEEE